MRLLSTLLSIPRSEIQDQFTSPDPLISSAWDTTQINLSWDDVGADNYLLLRNTSNTELGAATIYFGSDTYFEDTGLTINTTYYYFLQAHKSGYSDSAYATSTRTTFPYMPDFFYLFPGLGHGTLGVSGGTDNAFGVTSNTQGDDIDSFKSIINTSGPTATAVSSKAKVACSSRENAYKTYCGVSTPARYSCSAITWSGDFTVCVRAYGRTSGMTINRVLMGHNAGTNFIRFNSSTAMGMRIGGSVWAVNYATPITQTRWYNIVIQRSGTTIRVSLDQGATFGSASAAGNSVTFDRFMGDGVSGSDFDGQIELIAGVGHVMTQTEIDRTFSLMKGDAVIIPDNDDSIVPTVSGWNPLSAGNLLVDNTLGSAATASSSRFSRAEVLGGYGYALVHQKANTDYWLNDFWFSYRFSDSYVSDLHALGVPFENIDVHNNGGISIIGNRLIHCEEEIHYGVYTKPEVMILKKSGKNMDLTKVMIIPQGNGFANLVGAKTQYHQQIHYNNKIYTFAQEFCSTTWQQEVTEVNIVVFISSDGGISQEKYTIVTSGDIIQFWYVSAVFHEDGIFDLVLSNIQTALPEGRYRYVAKLRSTDGAQTWIAPGGGFSKTVVNNNPITRTEMINNATIIDANALAGNGKGFYFFHDPSNDEVYGLAANGNSEIVFMRQIANGAFETPVVISIPGHTLETSVLSSDGDNTPVVIKTGTNNYTLYFHETNSGSWLWSTATTTDSGVNWTFGEQLSQDNTKKFQRMHPSRNFHYQDKAFILAMKRVDATGVTEGSVQIETSK